MKPKKPALKTKMNQKLTVAKGILVGEEAARAGRLVAQTEIKRRLACAGFKVGSADEFLGLTAVESKLVSDRVDSAGEPKGDMSGSAGAHGRGATKAAAKKSLRAATAAGKRREK